MGLLRRSVNFQRTTLPSPKFAVSESSREVNQEAEERNVIEYITTMPSGERSVECSAPRSVWMVKVPRYLSELWEANEGNKVGILSTTDNYNALKLTSYPELSAKLNINKPEQDLSLLAHLKQAPETHKIILNEIHGQNMAVMVEDKTELKENVDLVSGNLKIVAKVVRRCDCRPDDDKYMRMKLEQIQKSQKPKKFVKQLERAAVKFKPVSVHEEDVVHNKMKKEGNKLVRGDPDLVRTALFQAFERHQYYRLFDLQNLIQQPAGYIKEILMEIGIYNTAPPHKNMWELKPEYRHYSSNV